MKAVVLLWLISSILLASSSAEAEELPDMFDNFKKVFIMDETVIEPTTGPTVSKDKLGRTCSCVPIYMCDDNEDGRNVQPIIDERFSNCQTSIEICCPTSNILSTPKIKEPLKTSGCGVRHENGLGFTITGVVKTESQFGEFPWTIIMLKTSDGSAICGGSLIHPKVVLTAAHCIKTLQARDIKVRAGEWDTQIETEPIPFQERAVATIIQHPNFNKRTLANDIAMVFVSEVFTKANNINTVCLPTENKNFDGNKNCIATGWGKAFFNLVNRYAVLMKKVEMDIIDYNTCNLALKTTRLGQSFSLHSSFICAGGAPGKDMCKGDGGGPLVCSAGNVYVLAGITSWGIGCSTGNPGVYAGVSQFRQWIDLTMAAAGLSSSTYIE